MQWHQVMYIGFLLSFGLLAGGLGPQNLFILRQGLERKHVLLTAAASVAGEGLLLLTGTSAMGLALATHAAFQKGLLVISAAYIGLHAATSLLRCFKGAEGPAGESVAMAHTPLQAITYALGFSLLNPWGWLDTVLILGGSAARYGGALESWFIFGAFTASAAWFFGLSLTASGFGRRVQGLRLWKVLEVLTSLLMLGCLSHFVAR